MTDVADVVCRHVGGEVLHSATQTTDEDWIISIHPADASPAPCGGFWNSFAGAYFTNSPEIIRRLLHGDQHPIWVKSSWESAKENSRTTLDYWPWVSKKIALWPDIATSATRRDFLSEALIAPAITLHGEVHRVATILRRDLFGQEILENVPQGTVITSELLTVRPDIRAAFNSISRQFDESLWIGRPVEAFCEEFGTYFDANETPVFSVPTNDE